MTREELDALTIWIEALIDLQIERALIRDYTTEYVRQAELRRELYAVIGIGHD